MSTAQITAQIGILVLLIINALGMPIMLRHLRLIKSEYSAIILSATMGTVCSIVLYLYSIASRIELTGIMLYIFIGLVIFIIVGTYYCVKKGFYTRY